MSDYMQRVMQGKTGDELRAMALESRRRSDESFARSDTDGFLSQWAADMSARQLEEQAKIADQGGRAQFAGLYHGDRRVAARIVELPGFKNPRQTVYKWELHLIEVSTYGRRYIPVAGIRTSTVQKQLGLRERGELAPAKAIVTTGSTKSTGLGGCANAFVRTVRTGDKWGRDAELIQETAK